ncbi:hypothetical protein IKF57_01770 [Candidatus Saccharibacteria bacterium]|nr:hypothetical protein [Candidatus Saccharibacteria bacterium]
MEYLQYFDDIESTKLAQYEQMQSVKKVFKSEEWQEYRNKAAEDLKKRKELNEALRMTCGKISDAINQLWGDPLIGFAREIHEDERIRDLDAQKIAEIQRTRKSKTKWPRILLLPLGPIVWLLTCFLSIKMVHEEMLAVNIGLAGLILSFAITFAGVKFYLLHEKLKGDDLIPIQELKKAVEAMSLVRETEQYQSIQELEGLRIILNEEIDKVSWPPVNWQYGRSSCLLTD